MGEQVCTHIYKYTHTKKKTPELVIAKKKKKKKKTTKQKLISERHWKPVNLASMLQCFNASMLPRKSTDCEPVKWSYIQKNNTFFMIYAVLLF